MKGYSRRHYLTETQHFQFLKIKEPWEKCKIKKFSVLLTSKTCLLIKLMNVTEIKKVRLYGQIQLFIVITTKKLY